MTVPRFWREIPQRYTLLASRCGACQAMYYPPRVVCPECRRRSIGQMESIPLAGRGTVVEWTRVHRPAAGYEVMTPYVVALVKAEEGPVLTGQLVDLTGEPRANMPVHAVFRRLGADGQAGVIHYGTKWAPDLDGEEE